MHVENRLLTKDRRNKDQLQPNVQEMSALVSLVILIVKSFMGVGHCGDG